MIDFISYLGFHTKATLMKGRTQLLATSFGPGSDFMRSNFLLFILVLCVNACAAAGRSSEGTSRNRNQITAVDIAETQAITAYDAISTLRPQWLRARGPTGTTDPTPLTPTVYMDGTRMGGLDFLRTIRVTDVADIQFLDPGRAAIRYGMGFTRGNIEVALLRR